MSDQKLNARNERYLGYLMGAGIGLMILALLLRGLGTIDNDTTTGSIFVVGLALFLLGLLIWLYLFRPWARFDDLKTPHYTGDHAHGEARHGAVDEAEAHGDEAVLVAAGESAASAAADLAQKAGVLATVPEPKTAIEPHVIQVPAPKPGTVASTAKAIGEAAHDAVETTAEAVKKTVEPHIGDVKEAGSTVASTVASTAKAIGEAAHDAVETTAEAVKHAAGEAAEAITPSRAAGIDLDEPSQVDDLTIIEGIGPKTNKALQAAGIRTFAALSRMTPGEISALLSEAKVRIVSPPDTWADQAKLAAQGDMDGLHALQAKLKGGLLKD